MLFWISPPLFHSSSHSLKLSSPSCFLPAQSHFLLSLHFSSLNECFHSSSSLFMLSFWCCVSLRLLLVILSVCIYFLHPPSLSVLSVAVVRCLFVSQWGCVSVISVLCGWEIWGLSGIFSLNHLRKFHRGKGRAFLWSNLCHFTQKNNLVFSQSCGLLSPGPKHRQKLS